MGEKSLQAEHQENIIKLMLQRKERDFSWQDTNPGPAGAQASPPV